MSLVSRPYPGLFGGVSQQPPAMRHPTHCSEQLNAVATVVDGLYKRPGTTMQAALALTSGFQSVAGSYGFAHGHVIDKGSSGLYQLILVSNNMMLYDLRTGAVQSVNAPMGFGYLTSLAPETAFRCVTVADYTFIVNTGKVVTNQAATTTAQAKNTAYFMVRSAVPKITYTALVNDVAYSFYSGDTPTVASVVAGLRTAISAGYTATTLPNTSIVKVTGAVGTTIKASVTADGWGTTTFQAIQDGVDRYGDLPPVFEENQVLKIKGAADASSDPYYVRWTGNRWEECNNPGDVTDLTASTMPHQLRPDGSGGWVFEPATWAPRKVGDNITNPLPSFVGRRIRGVFFHRNRMGFLAGDSVVLSQSGAYFNFFATTATQVLDTDPIDLDATSEKVDSLEWTVPFNNDLLVWSSTRQQFILTGGELLTPETAQLKPTTSFEAYPGVQPQAVGNRVMFASMLGNYSQLNLYRASEDTRSNTADDVTEHCPNYVPAAPRLLAVSGVVKAAVVVPSAGSNTLHFFKYEVNEQDTFTQKAWGTFTLSIPGTVRVISAHWDSRTLFLLLHVTAPNEASAGGRFVIEALNMDQNAADLNAPFGLRLDGRLKATFVSTSGGNSTLDIPRLADGNYKLFACVPGSEPQELTQVSCAPNPATLVTRYVVQGNLTGVTVWGGWPFTMRYVFTEPVMRDAQGGPIQSAVIKLKSILVRYVKTGWFKAKVVPFLRGTYEYPFVGRNVGQPGQGPSQLALSTGDFSIPVGTQASTTEVSIESDSHLPVNLPYAEWVGSVTMKAAR